MPRPAEELRLAAGNSACSSFLGNRGLKPHLIALLSLK